MKTLLHKRAAWAVAAIGLLAGAAHAADAAKPASDDDLVARGRYLSAAGDCIACHTAPSGKPYAGGLAIDSPFGKIYSTNITPSASHGIGGYSEEQFAKAVREGINAKGEHLYPAMPYTSYAGITDEDMKALYAFFMKGVQPVDDAAPTTQLGFPFNQRWAIGGWNLLFADGKPFKPTPDKSDAWNRGHYLVSTLGHCDSCHTPRNAAMGEKTDQWLAGGAVGPWRAPNITSDPISGIGGWTQGELVQYLRTGTVAGKGQAAGGMAEAIQNSLQHLSDSDLTAIATYLKETTPIRDPDDKQASYTFGDKANYEPALRADNPGIGFNEPGLGYPKLTTGAALYSGNCSSCHQPAGQGTKDGAFPSLVHNSVLGRQNADNLVMVILDGLHITTQGQERLMPAFGDVLNDDEVAKLATFVMSEYGNPEVKVSAQQVSQLRAGGASVTGELITAMGIGGVVLVLLILGWIWHARRRHKH